MAHVSALLGVPDGLIKENEKTSWQINKIGGHPDWMKAATPMPFCCLCQRKMTLVTQLYCPLGDSPYHRSLFIFVCHSKKCSQDAKGWRVVRMQMKAETSEEPSQAHSSDTKADSSWCQGQDDWGEGQDDWGQGQDDLGQGQDAWCQDQDDWGDPGQKPAEADTEVTGEFQNMSVSDNTTECVQQEIQDIKHNFPALRDDASLQMESQTTNLSVSSKAVPAVNCTKANAEASVGVTGYADTVKKSVHDVDCTRHSASGSVDSHGDNTTMRPHSDTSQLKDKNYTATADEDVTISTDSESVGEEDALRESGDNKVEVEGVAIDDEGVQRMLGLLATGGPSPTQQTATEGGHEESSVVLPAYYLSVFEESSLSAEDHHYDPHVERLMAEYQRGDSKFTETLSAQNSKSNTRGSGDAEKYEKTEVRHGDKTHYKFLKTLAKCPEQCVRYQWKGKPLLIQNMKETATSRRCDTCGSPLVFELQLLPPLICLLKTPSCTDPLAEFGTVLVYSCIQSCWEDSGIAWREECVLLQQDPDHHLFQ